MKKRVRNDWEIDHRKEKLIYVWGFDADETGRMRSLIEANPQAQHEFPLVDKGLSKEEVHGLFERTYDFKRPLMYDMGYPNNNCIGCIKGGMGYWNKIRVDFPEVFESRKELEKVIGHTILKECSLEDLDPQRGNMNTEVFPDCGIMCYMAEREMK